MNILVTGAAGFIGSHLAERLVRDGHFVIGLDAFTDYYSPAAKQENLKTLKRSGQFALINADLVTADLGALLRNGSLEDQGLACGTIDYIFHLAAQPGVRSSWGKEFETYTRNNIVATQRLLEAAKEMPLAKFVYASSSSVYGDAEAFPTPEDVTPRPISPYGVTKLSAEQLCLLYARNYDMPVVCTRYFTVYGPRQRPDMAFHRFIRSILHGDEICIFGDGEQTRDFTFVDDAVEGTLRAGFSPVRGEVLNIGGGSRVTLNHVIDLLGQLVGRVRRRHLPAQHGDVRDTAADISRAARLLGYEPQVSLERGLALEAEWLEQALAAERVHV